MEFLRRLSGTGQSNKSDEPPAFFNGQLDVQDIHRVNKHDGDNRAKHLYDNAHGDDQKSVWEHIVASEAARAAPMDGRAMEAARPLRSAEESRRATATQSPMPAVDDFGTPIGSYMVPGGNKKMSNKKDGWGAFETADIHRVNVRAPAKGAGYLIDNVQSATAAPTVWEWTVQSEAAKGAQPSEARVDQYPPNMQRKSADPVAMGKKRALVVPALERMSAGDAGDSSGRGNLSRGASLDSPLQPTLGEIFLPYSA